jgi:hypothetical protein
MNGSVQSRLGRAGKFRSNSALVASNGNRVKTFLCPIAVPVNVAPCGTLGREVFESSMTRAAFNQMIGDTGLTSPTRAG